ncbi:hypothetical protein Y032_0140g2186 [Ancylostoma ceylanicum]|uniref:Uncharacterized protein n=1 Tax=Ancylostoma ceylanicum TaxID=53326 RepID=A0A016T3E5_9BILA|nr:hypothetical protein Y032_0140g2186 [Ancylostoma ceylanicum]
MPHKDAPNALRISGIERFIKRAHYIRLSRKFPAIFSLLFQINFSSLIQPTSLCYATKLSDRPSLHQLQVMLPVWREDSDPTRRRLARVVRPHIQQFSFIAKCKRRRKREHEDGD